MRFKGLALAASAIVFAACGGGDAGTDTAGMGATPGTPDATATATTPAGGGTAAAVTGTTHEVRMLGDAQGYRFDPANITVKQGDGIRFIMVSGGPHNVAFDQGAVGAAATQLAANMPNTTAPLMGPYLSNPNETYTMSFASVPAGTYEYVCTPHLAMGMKGNITVTQ